MKHSTDWYGVPKELRSPATHLDNLVLVPASELASLRAWQTAARQLPAGDVLVVVPKDNLQLREVGRRIDSVMRQRGRHSRVATIPSPHHE